eukprot:1160119-Pelagomonas_calceolata.AAC.7
MPVVLVWNAADAASPVASQGRSLANLLWQEGGARMAQGLGMLSLCQDTAYSGGYERKGKGYTAVPDMGEHAHLRTTMLSYSVLALVGMRLADVAGAPGSDCVCTANFAGVLALKPGSWVRITVGYTLIYQDANPSLHTLTLHDLPTYKGCVRRLEILWHCAFSFTGITYWEISHQAIFLRANFGDANKVPV